jgi:ApbE superfamily uncharacterized protein (UPF0280 family)
MVSYRVAVRETDLHISSTLSLEQDALNLILECRRSLEAYIAAKPGFLTAMRPWPPDPFAPFIVREMIEAGTTAGVGPMAAVAGAIAEYVGRGLLKMTDQVIVENGGDIFLKTDRPCRVAILAGESPLSGRIGILAAPGEMPLSVCTSSGKVGHSLSTGKSDAVCVVSKSASLADAAATALANRVCHPRDLAELPSFAKRIGGLVGVAGIMGDRLVVWGSLELVEL